MAFRVELMARAERELDIISAQSGSEWFREFEDAILSLEEMPTRCAVSARLSTAKRAIRQHLCGWGHDVYWVYFSVDGEFVKVLHLRHTARKPLKRLYAE